VFRNGDGFCSSNAALHEIGHTLGGLQPVAPHAFDGSHCNDAYEDTMCYSSSPWVAHGERGTVFDHGNDDYWSLPGAPLGWWTVDESRFLCPDAACNVVGGAAPDPPLDPDSATTVRAPATLRAARSDAHVKMRARRTSHGVWTLRLHASGAGRGVIVVRCRRRRRGQVRTVLTRATRLPRTLHARVRCVASRPRARVFLR
jgi:hypothetical protein